MAIVESSIYMSRSEEKLMAGPRIQLPPLPTQTNPQHTFVGALGLDTAKTSLKRRPSHEGLVPRPTKQFTFNTGTGSDMETYHGHVRTPADAIILFEACRIGLLPRVQRRLSEKERQSIKSGSVFVWDEREAGMRRWTDGKSWSASRVSGSFLTYREMEGKRGGGGNGYPPPVTVLSRAGRTPDSTQGSESDIDVAGEEGPDGYRYKPDGLVKQSFSITTSSGNHLHLISYYSRAHPASQQLNSPSSDPQLRNIRPTKGMYPESTVHEHQNIPAVTRSPMAGAPYTTTPQMAGYARQGPPQWPQQQYGWSPNTPPQPPYQYYGYQYGPGPMNGPPPPASAQSPAPYSQAAHHGSSQPHDRKYSGYDSQPASAHHDYQGYDSRRYPQTPPASRPLTHQNHSNSPDIRNRPLQAPYQPLNSYPNAPREGYPHGQYDPNRYPGQPQIKEQAAPTALSQTLQTNAVQQHAAPQQGWTPGPLPPPPSARTPPVHYQHPQSANSSSTPIDPQLMGASSGPQPRAAQPNEYPNSSASSHDRNEPAGSVSSQSNGYPSAGPSTIPSIGALMNGSAPQNPRPSSSKPPPTNGQPKNGYSTYAPSSDTKSPAEGPKGKDGLQDISSSNKVGFGEDKRAINILDRGFRV